MDASPALIRPSDRSAGSRRWRSLLAGLISLAMALALFIPCTCDGVEDAGPAFSIAQSIGDAGDKAPAHLASIHCDHCLTHVAPMASQETVVAIAYAPYAYGDMSTRAPASADRLSPFEPPRA
jgi:hypothetical protein